VQDFEFNPEEENLKYATHKIKIFLESPSSTIQKKRRKNVSRWSIDIDMKFCVGRRKINLDCTEDRHGKYKMARIEIPMEKRPPNTTKSCEVNIKYSHGTKRILGTT
jgi:hypothetical protein